MVNFLVFNHGWIVLGWCWISALIGSMVQTTDFTVDDDLFADYGAHAGGHSNRKSEDNSKLEYLWWLSRCVQMQVALFDESLTCHRYIHS